MCKVSTIEELKEMKEDKEMSDFLDSFGCNIAESNKYIDELLENVNYRCALYKSLKKLHLSLVK